MAKGGRRAGGRKTMWPGSCRPEGRATRKTPPAKPARAPARVRAPRPGESLVAAGGREIAELLECEAHGRQSLGSLPGLAEHAVRQPGGFLDEGQRLLPIEAAIDRGEMRKGRRLGEELEGQPVAGIVGVEEIAREGEELAAGHRPPRIADGRETVHP